MSSPPSSLPGDHPPYYILVSQTPVASASTEPGPTYKSFSHPVIQYHYADDVPNMLLPQSPHEQVLILDYDPTNMTVPMAQSLSPDLAVLGVKVAEAPSSTIDDNPNPRSNNYIYVIETTAKPTDLTPDIEDQDTVHSLLSRFKQRNAVLRATLEYPESRSQDVGVMEPSHAYDDPFRIQSSERHAAPIT
ncbi:hypothetical protein PHLGIDRAFT_21318 [Phlebiopsis gigantea 11061_1 CR5-6]|uniref:Uncharacterized protein n=1 Tax=Phlebiopsis gigantea (strain 11061_1 CR5-6) TaxID=745531 RepID=A0A0C3SDP0_PHLG1|nr:hypothetical protein PHLGIDRAFT_21318 [Phlebiopsis gigantea 11061_1 CR5-6]